LKDHCESTVDKIRDIKLCFNNRYLQVTYENNPGDPKKKTQAFEKLELVDIVNGNKKIFSFDCRFDDKDDPVMTFPMRFELPEKKPEGQDE
jgi:hypothetical protein